MTRLGKRFRANVSGETQPTAWCACLCSCKNYDVVLYAKTAAPSSLTISLANPSEWV